MAVTRCLHGGYTAVTRRVHGYMTSGRAAASDMVDRHCFFPNRSLLFRVALWSTAVDVILSV